MRLVSPQGDKEAPQEAAAQAAESVTPSELDAQGSRKGPVDRPHGGRYATHSLQALSMTLTTFDREIRSIHYAHEIVPGSPMSQVVTQAADAFDSPVEIVYEVEGGYIVQSATEAVFVGDDGEFALTDIYEALDETVPLKCPACGKALKKGPLFREATTQVKRKCAACGAKWNVMLRPKSVERGGKRKATITTADFTRIDEVATAKRNYKKEYRDFHGKPGEKKNRAARNAARASKGLEVGDKREVDHKKPLSKGGDNEPENLRVVSRETNRSKGDGEESVAEADSDFLASSGGLTFKLTTAQRNEMEAVFSAMTDEGGKTRTGLHIKPGRAAEVADAIRTTYSSSGGIEVKAATRRSMLKLADEIDAANEDEIDEGINDAYILKAVFLTGGAGAGKGFISNIMFGGTGLKVVNSDTQLESAMKKAGLSLKKDLASLQVQQKGGLRDQAKQLTTKRLDLYIKGRLGLVIDSTAAHVANVEKKVKMLRALGYDCSMVFVSTTLETSLARNKERARTVPEAIVTKDWNLVQQNLKKYRTLFGSSNFREIANDDALSPREIAAKLMPQLTRMAMPMLNAPVKNPIGKQWMEREREKIAARAGLSEGDSWQSVKGVRKVVGKMMVGGVEKLLIQTGDNRATKEIIDPSELAAEKTFNAKQLASREKSQAAAKVAAAKEAAARFNDSGFTSSMSPMKAAKVRAALEKTMRVSGKHGRRGDLIRELVKSGHRVKTVKGKRILQGKSGTFFFEKDLTKAGFDFAEYLTKHNESLSEDAILLLGLAGSAVAGAVLSKIAIGAKRTVEKALQLHRQGKPSAAEMAMAKLGDRDRKQIEALFAAETRRMKNANPKAPFPSRPRKGAGVMRESLDEGAPFNVKQFEKMGAAAFKAGKMATPMHDPKLMAAVKKLTKGKPVGYGIDILAAWSRGWHTANLKAPVESLEEDELSESARIANEVDFIGILDGMRITKRGQYEGKPVNPRNLATLVSWARRQPFWNDASTAFAQEVRKGLVRNKGRVHDMLAGTQNEALEEAMLRMTDTRTKKVEWEGSLRQFVKDNAEDRETVKKVKRLRPGQSVKIGGGAAPEFILTLVKESLDERTKPKFPARLLKKPRKPRSGVIKIHASIGDALDEGSSDVKAIKVGMARAMFVDWWASEHERKAEDDTDYELPWRGGDDLMNVAPKTTANALRAAVKLVRQFESKNGDIGELFDKAVEAGGQDDPRSFGHYLAMSALGHGVSWEDSNPDIDIEYPDIEYYESVEDDMTLVEIECLCVDDLTDALQEAIQQNPSDVHLVAEHFGPFEAAIEAGEFERAELLFEVIVKVLPLDEATHMSTHARISRVRNARRGTTKSIQSGAKNKGQVRQENRKRRIARRSSPTSRMKTSRTSQVKRSLSIARESLDIVSRDQLDEAGREQPIWHVKTTPAEVVLAKAKKGMMIEIDGEQGTIEKISKTTRKTPIIHQTDPSAPDIGTRKHLIVTVTIKNSWRQRVRFTFRRSKDESLEEALPRRSDPSDPTKRPSVLVHSKDGRVATDSKPHKKKMSDKERDKENRTLFQATRGDLVWVDADRIKGGRVVEGMDESPLGLVKRFLRGSHYTATRNVNLMRTAAGTEEGPGTISIKKGDDILVTGTTGDEVSFTHKGQKARMPKKQLSSFELVNEGTILQITGPKGVEFRQAESDPDRHYHDHILPKGVQDDPLPHDSVADYRAAIAYLDRDVNGDPYCEAQYEAAKAEYLHKIDVEIAIVNEVSPPGWEARVKKMKRDPDIENPWKLAWYLYNKQKKNESLEEDTNAHGIEFNARQLLSMWEDEDEATRGTFEEWRVKYFKGSALDEAKEIVLSKQQMAKAQRAVKKHYGLSRLPTEDEVKAEIVSIQRKSARGSLDDRGEMLKAGLEITAGGALRFESLDEGLITVKVTASNGDYWTTQIQGPFAKAKAYFMGNEFNVGRGGKDLMVKIKKVELVEGLDEHDMQYKTLNDAEHYDKGYGKGSTEIWYMRDATARTYGLGLDFLRQHESGSVPTKKTYKTTHKLIGKIKQQNPERIFGMMQGERWSPDGEARTMLGKLGIHHTSMSVGDIIKTGTRVLFVDRNGFTPLD